MKRIGVISDVHGNLPALEAVLAELEREELDGVVCLGDVAVGPFPSESLERVGRLGCAVVKGNWDDWLSDGIPTPRDDVGRRILEMGEWWAARLSAGEHETLRGYADTVELELDDGETVLCCHGTPGSHTEGVYAETPEEELAAALVGRTPGIVLCGHTHVQLLRRLGGALVVNAGSVGLPFASWPPRPIRVAPWAEYAVLEHGGGRLRVDLRRTTYDVDAVLDACLASGVPHARWWVDCWDRG